MVLRTLASAALVVLILGCSGSTASTPPPDNQGPGATATPAASSEPGGNGGQATPAAPAGGDVKAIAQSLLPPGATETNHLESTGVYILYGSSTSPMSDLESFWDNAIPAAGLSQSGKFTLDQALTIAFTNPDGGIVATPDDTGGITFIISVGTSS